MKFMLQRRLSILLLMAALPLTAHSAREGDKNLGWPGTTIEGAPCWGTQQGYGPFDYSTASAERRHLVEIHHFTPNVEQLVRGNHRRDPSSDLDYTLRAFPNHHRALWSVSRYHLRKLKQLGEEELLRLARIQEGKPPAECYFNRALLFAPEDALVRVVYGIYLHRRDQHDAAMSQYSKAEEKLPEHSELLYNIGLLYLDMNDVSSAKKYAEQAKAQGYPLTGLHNKIERLEAQTKNESPVGN